MAVPDGVEEVACSLKETEGDEVAWEMEMLAERGEGNGRHETGCFKNQQKGNFFV